jgi:hypothetical protein
MIPEVEFSTIMLLAHGTLFKNLPPIRQEFH